MEVPMKRAVLVLIALTVLTGLSPMPAAGQQKDPKDPETPAPSPAWSAVWTTDVRSRYYGEIVNGDFSNGEPVVQSRLNLTRPIGRTSFDLMLWGSKGLSSPLFKNTSDEVDVIFTATRPIGPVTVSGNMGVFFLAPTARFHNLIMGVRVAKQFALGGGLRAEAFVKLDSLSLIANRQTLVHGGSFPTIGLALERHINGRFGLVGQVAYIRDMNGAFGFKKGAGLSRGDVGLRIQINKHWALIVPKVQYGGSYDDPLRPGRVTWSGTCVHTF
jgi:hypothetical protein